MPITSVPQQVTPGLWTYTYLQAPLNGQARPYLNVPSAQIDLGTIAASGVATCNVALANVFKMVAGGNCTVAFSNIPATGSEPKAQFWQLEIKGGGSFTVTWPASIKWDGGGASNVAPLLSTNTTVLNFMTRDGGTTIFGAYAFADLNV
jgi:hypothetical protein